jgi:hypothetical protein
VGVEEAIAELERVLAEEREAIRKLDGARVLELARRKQSLMTMLRDAQSHFTPASAAAMLKVVPALRHNGILLAHARSVLRDAIAVVRSHGGTASLSVPTSPAAARPMLSVRG